MNLHGDLAESWETPDALTYAFRDPDGNEPGEAQGVMQ